MDQILLFLISLGIISYVCWIIATLRSAKWVLRFLEMGMFVISLLLLWTVFKLNLDFGLILSIATIFAGLSWFLGKFLEIRNLLEESKSYFWILLIILFIRSFWYEPYQIPSSSMEPGLQIGDFVLVNKSVFGLKVPGTTISINKGSKPERGDVAVFYPPHTLCKAIPEDARPDLVNIDILESQLFLSRFLSLQKARCTRLGTKYVKRVVGLPGDTIQLSGHELWVNGKKAKKELLNSEEGNKLFEETLGNSIHIIRTNDKSLYSEHKWIIPEGKYLAIGDNRDNSLDSRDWGYFSEKYLIGKAEFIWLHWGSFSEFPTLKRNSRIR